MYWGEVGGKEGMWVLTFTATWRICVCVCPGFVKLDLIIHLEAVTLLPKLTNETPSCQESHTGHSDQLLNENDQVSSVPWPEPDHTFPRCTSHCYKARCAPALFQGMAKVCHRCSI